MTPREEPFLFACEGERLLGIVAHADGDADVGVLVVVGGPQYRVGSHRQFVLLARSLAEAGFPAMRFDYRGMGDATGAMRDFEAIGADVAAALAAFAERVPRLRRIVLWGLCDAASAALFRAGDDPRIAGLVLLNPWVRTEQGIARTYLRHYYLRRLFDGAAWRRLLRGETRLGASAGSLARAMGDAAGVRGTPRDAAAAPPARSPLPERMADSLARFRKDVLFVLSGDDFTAKEFRAAIDGNARWTRALEQNRVEWHAIADANHTFATRAWRDDVAAATLAWLRRVAGRPG